jgi:hypothetical protein
MRHILDTGENKLWIHTGSKWISIALPEERLVAPAPLTARQRVSRAARQFFGRFSAAWAAFKYGEFSPPYDD